MARQDSPGAETAPDKRWRDGPVKYLLSEEEHRRYGRLESSAARGAFIERFWSKRALEFRDRFDALCRKADATFVEPLRSGWQTDRGRVLILLGDPDAVRHDAGEARGRDREIWTYLHPPGGARAPLEVIFYRNTAGQFSLVPEPAARRGVFGSAVEREAERQRIRAKLRGENLLLSELAIEDLVESFLGPESSPFLPEGSSAPRTSSSGRRGEAHPETVFEQDFAMTEAAYFFESADKSVLVLLVLELRPLRPAGYRAQARILGDPQGDIELEACDGPDEGSMLFVGRAHLEPGTYGLRLAVLDAVRGSLAVRSVALAVPELGTGRFSASSVVPAERFGTLQEGRSSPFAIGSEEVIPRPRARFSRGEPLRLYLQVYDAAPDPATGKPRIDVSFRFRRGTDGKPRRHTKPLVVAGAEGASMGLALPVGDWPLGDYRVVVDLHDRVSGARTSTEGAFTLGD